MRPTRPAERPPDADLASAIERLARATAALESPERQAALNWAKIASYDEEIGFTANGTLLTSTSGGGINISSRNLFLVRHVIAVIPGGATGNLVLGTLNIPLQTSAFTSTMWKLLKPDDVRTLSSSTAGPMSICLMGEQYSPLSTVR